ncbi:MAG: M3 family metallopeptidase [Oceanicoccus sp.]
MNKALLLITTSIILSACQNSATDGNNNNQDALSAAPGNFQSGLTATELTEQCSQQLKNANGSFRRLESLQPPFTVDNLLRPVDQMFVDIDNDTGMTYLLNNVHPDTDLQAAADTCIQNFSNLLTEIGLSKPLYERLQQVDVSDKQADTQRYLTELLRDFKRSGVDKNERERESIRAISEKITALGQDFAKNIREDVRSITLNSVADLDGMPQDYIEQHLPDENGLITITTDYPDLFPLLRYAKNDQARLALYKQYLNRGFPDNDQVLNDIVRQRHTLATALDYEDFATYALEDMMVQSPETVSNFIKRISDMAIPRAESDYGELLKALQTIDPSATSVGNWQKSFLEETVRREKYSVDTKIIRQYFQYNEVRDGIFTLVEDLFSVEIRPWQTPVWDDKVESFEIVEHGQVIGRFYLDMHPRTGKYKHAAQFGVQSGIAGQQLPVAALVCNFPGGDDTPGLMEHTQVETFLHEFGHLIHSIFGGQQRWGAFAGVATERDFVEAPSQMLEEWIWDYETLKEFAYNQQGEVIPEELVNKMRIARDFARGTHIRNQMFYASLSLAIYQTPPDELDLKETMIQLQTEYSPFAYIDDTHFYASFGHLFGYSAAYYTYMWSEVIAADILEQFKESGMRNKDIANRYRKTVLAPGGSKDAAQLVEDFLGRPFNFDAFVKRLNQDT